MQGIVKGTAVALIAALLVGPSAPAGVIAQAPSQSAVIAAEQQRDTSSLSRSFVRGDCLDCPPKVVVAKPSPSASPTPPPKPSTPKSNCSKNVRKVWSGPCRPAPGKAQVQEIMRQVLAERGWAGQFDCLNSLIDHESDWNVYAVNPRSLAYGIPQALPGKKMASAGSDWGWNPRTQLRWQMGYIAGRYGTPCAAWSFWRSHHWY